MTRRALILAAVTGAIAMGPTAAWANPLDAFGFGARGMAMAGALAASVNDPSAVYYNPAGVAASDDLRIDVAYSYVKPTLRIEGGDLDVDASQGLEVGVLLTGRLLDRRIGFGIALHLPDNHVTRIRSLPQRQPRFVLFDNRPQRIVIGASVGFEIIEGLSVGAGLTFLSNSFGNLDIQGKVGFDDTNLGFLTTAVDQDLASVKYASAGIMFRRDGWRVGAAFRDEFNLKLTMDLKLSGDIIIDDDPDSQPIVEGASVLLGTVNYNLFSPRQVVLGFGYQGDGFLVEANVAWLQWSRFPAPASEVTLEVDVPGLNTGFAPSDPPIAPAFHDIFIARLGAEGAVFQDAVAQVKLRGGYFYEPSPAPDQPAQTNYVDMDKHAFSLGLGIELTDASGVLPKPASIDVSGMALWLPERSYLKDDPADPIGDYRADGLVLGLKISASLVF